MGKNRVIKSLGKNIGNIVIHKILVKHTNNLKAVAHLKHEVITYRDTASVIASEFNWNEKDKEEVKLKALKKFKEDMKKYYNDVKFPVREAEKLIDETINEMML